MLIVETSWRCNGCAHLLCEIALCPTVFLLRFCCRCEIEDKFIVQESCVPSKDVR